MSDHAVPIILVPGFWLGAWAWDEVADALRADGHDVTAITLPGLESPDTDRSRIRFEDHVEAICEAVRAKGSPVVLAVHSAAGFSGYAASDRVTDRIAAMVYVDTAPGIGAMEPDFPGDEKPMVWEEIEEGENLDGLSEEHKERFRQRAVPVPGGVVRGSVPLTNDARRDVPSTIICTGFTAEQYQSYAAEHPDWPFLAGIPELRNVTWVDLPTSHWPMWSRPRDLAQVIGAVAKAHDLTEPMTAEREAAISALLVEAEKAHAVFEQTQLNGVYDKDWPRWYGAYLVEHGIDTLIGREVQTDELAAFLASSFTDFEAAEPNRRGAWVTYTARRIAAELQ